MKKTKSFDRLIVFVAAGLCFSLTASAKDQATEDVDGESKSAFQRSSKWYLKNWPSKASQEGFREIDNGSHTWKNSKGAAVGEILIKNSQPFSGITYTQGASDYRMVTHYDKGKPRLLMSHVFKKGHWIVFQNNLPCEQGGADKPATAAESKAKGEEKLETESEVRPQ